MPRGVKKKPIVSLKSDEVLHCNIFECHCGVYPSTICCRCCPLYDTCESPKGPCLNDPKVCGVWDDAEKRRARESLMKQVKHAETELEDDYV